MDLHVDLEDDEVEYLQSIGLTDNIEDALSEVWITDIDNNDINDIWITVPMYNVHLLNETGPYS